VTFLTLRLRLEEAEVRTSNSGKKYIALKFGAVQQPEFGPVFDSLTLDPSNEFLVARLGELLHAMYIQLDPSRNVDAEELCLRLLDKRRYVVARLMEKEWSGQHVWQIRKYERRRKTGDGE
jgi:hypothetical protein